MNLEKMAHAVRALSIDMVEAAASGHPGMPLGAADIMTVLFAKVMNYDFADPTWMNRDRFVLSAGHASALLYSTLHLAGFPLSEDDLKSFRKLGSVTCGHPEYEPDLGIECTTGPLGQGIGMAVGMAIAERLANQRAPQATNHYTYVLAGDGCLMEGISYEACALAAKLRLNKLILLFDDNNNTIDGHADLATGEDQIARFRACGWETLEADGHDYNEIERVLLEAKQKERPVFVKLKTKIGKFSVFEDSCKAHGTVLGAEAALEVRRKIGMGDTAFEIPADVRKMWQEATKERSKAHTLWSQRLGETGKQSIDQLFGDKEGFSLAAAIDLYKKELASEKPTATRVASGEVLERILPVCPQLIGGSADLGGPNCTATKHSKSLNSGESVANYINYGVREHAMGAIMNGIALHGPFVPYGGTFFAFADYMKPAIRLAALMNLHSIFVLTHDSIAIGEDGPTHQPIEHFSAYRALPNMPVIRPADRQETAEAWQLAVQRKAPVILALTRLAVGETEIAYRKENLVAKGGFLVMNSSTEPDLTLIASGSELAQTLKAAEELSAKGVVCEVVSMPCLEFFLEQDEQYRKEVVRGKKVFVVEAAATPGWEKIRGFDLAFKAMDSFGASGKTADLIEHFGYTPAKIAAAAEAFIASQN